MLCVRRSSSRAVLAICHVKTLRVAVQSTSRRTVKCIMRRVVSSHCFCHQLFCSINDGLLALGWIHLAVKSENGCTLTNRKDSTSAIKPPTRDGRASRQRVVPRDRRLREYTIATASASALPLRSFQPPRPPASPSPLAMQSLLLRCRRRLVLLTLLASLVAGVSSIVSDTAKTPLTVLVSLPFRPFSTYPARARTWVRALAEADMRFATGSRRR